MEIPAQGPSRGAARVFGSLARESLWNDIIRNSTTAAEGYLLQSPGGGIATERRTSPGRPAAAQDSPDTVSEFWLARRQGQPPTDRPATVFSTSCGALLFGPRGALSRPG